MVMQLKFNG